MKKQLLRSTTNRMLSGVCGGIGEYLDIDPTLIRLVWAIFTCVTVGAGLAAYIIAAIIIPADNNIR